MYTCNISSEIPLIFRITEIEQYLKLYISYPFEIMYFMFIKNKSSQICYTPKSWLYCGFHDYVVFEEVYLAFTLIVYGLQHLISIGST